MHISPQKVSDSGPSGAIPPPHLAHLRVAEGSAQEVVGVLGERSG